MKTSLPMQLLELWTLTPQVITTRLFRMALSSQHPAKSDVREMNEMWQEKVIAMMKASQVALTEGMRFQTKLQTDLMTHALNPALYPQVLTQTFLKHAPAMSDKTTEKMLQPFHSKVKSNAKRLNK